MKRLSVFLCFLFFVCGCTHIASYPENWSTPISNVENIGSKLTAQYECKGEEISTRDDLILNIMHVFGVNRELPETCDIFEIEYSSNRMSVNFYAEGKIIAFENYVYGVDFIEENGWLVFRDQEVNSKNPLIVGKITVASYFSLSENYDLIVRMDGSGVGVVLFLPVPQYRRTVVLGLFKKKSNKQSLLDAAKSAAPQL